jgi:hypothetical protein
MALAILHSCSKDRGRGERGISMVYKHPNEIKDRECPNGWNECTVCQHERDCRAGLYHGEDILIKAAEIAERVTHKEAVESVRSIKRDMHSEFMAMTPDECMNWFYGYRVQGLHYKEPIPQDGPSTPGSSKSGKVKKSKRGNKVSIEPWTAIV